MSLLSFSTSTYCKEEQSSREIVQKQKYWLRASRANAGNPHLWIYYSTSLSQCFKEVTF